MRTCDKHEIAYDEYHHPGTGSWRTAWNKKQCPVCEAEAEIRRHEKCEEWLRNTLEDLVAACEAVPGFSGQEFDSIRTIIAKAGKA